MKLHLKRMNFKKIALFGAVVLCVSILFGQGCGKFATNQGGSSNTLGSSGVDSIEIIPNTKTVAMSYSRQMVDSMVSCTGIKQATTAINTVYESRKGSLSQFGDALEVSAPMLMATVSVAGEVCNKLLADEMPLAPAQRRIFQSIDFTSSPRNLASADIAASVRRLARSCWSRDESQEELDILLNTVNNSFDSSSTAKNAMLMLCTGMLSSLSGLEN